MMDNLADSGWKGFLELCLNCSSTQELEEVFHLFLTFEEKETLSARFLIIKALSKGELTQREIASHYRVSIAQITRGSNALKQIKPSLKKLLEPTT